MVWADPVSLAATQGIAFAFSSSRYLDVSVPWVCLLMCYLFTHGYCPIKGSGFPHSEISGSSLTYSSPKHIGVSAVLLRLLVPRHPPCALPNLTKRFVKKLTAKCGLSLHELRCFIVSMSSYPVFKEQVFESLMSSCKRRLTHLLRTLFDMQACQIESSSSRLSQTAFSAFR